MKKNKLMQIFLLVMLLLNTVLPSLATTVSAAGITKMSKQKLEQERFQPSFLKT